MFNALAPYVSIQISPIDEHAAYREPYTLYESYAGLLVAAMGDVPSDNSSAPTGFNAKDWQNQQAFQGVNGALDWVRFAPNGRFYRGIKAANESKNDRELCGFVVGLRIESSWNRMSEEAIKQYTPRTPKDALVLQWKAKQGKQWETVLPAYADAVSQIRHAEAPANKTVKATTVAPLVKDQGFEMTLSLGGLADGHTSEPALRVMWGNTFSVVFRGTGSKAFPQIELREEGEWKVRKILDEGKSMGADFWRSRHTLRIYQLGGKVVVELDGVGYYITLFRGVKQFARPIRATWPRARVEVSVFGVDAIFGIATLSGKEASGKNRVASFGRLVQARRQETARFFKVSGPRPITDSVTKVVAQIRGDGLEDVGVAGTYDTFGWINYSVFISCGDHSSPLFSTLAVHFPASATEPRPPDVDVRLAVSEWEVESSDPESAQAGQASFKISREALRKVCETKTPSVDWKTVLAPFRAVKITIRTVDPATGVVDTSSDGAAFDEVLFRGWIKPNNYEITDSADQTFSVVCGDVISERLNEHAALVDQRFPPLDLTLNPNRGVLYGAECVRFIIGVVLGEQAFLNFNAPDENHADKTLYYFVPGKPALLDFRNGSSLAVLMDIPQKGGFYFPPPFGESALSWINKLAGYDFAVLFHDPRTNAIFYGEMNEFFAERSNAGTIAYNANDAFITKLSNEGEFDLAYNDIRVWGHPSKGMESLVPSLLIGEAGDNGLNSLDPISIAQSWRRSLLFKPDVIPDKFISQEWAQDLAYNIWTEWEGARPEKFSLDFNTGFPGVRWGELISFVAPNEDVAVPRRITKVVHRGHLAGDGGNQDRFSTTIEARSLSASGQ